jgi:hypothetical protein
VSSENEYAGAETEPSGPSCTNVAVSEPVVIVRRTVPPTVTPKLSAPALYTPVFGSPVKKNDGNKAVPNPIEDLAPTNVELPAARNVVSEQKFQALAASSCQIESMFEELTYDDIIDRLLK